MRGIALGTGVRIITAWIPCKGIVNWRYLTDEEIKILRRINEK